MQKNSNNFSVEDAMRLANSPAGQQLLELLKKQSPQDLSRAADQAAAGDFRQAKDTLSSLLASEEAQSLLRQLGG